MTNGQVSREVSDLDSLRYLMKLLAEVRDRESSMEMEINPIMDMYRMLESYLPPRGSWRRRRPTGRPSYAPTARSCCASPETRTEVAEQAARGTFKRTLLEDIKDFKVGVESFKNDFTKNRSYGRYGLDPNVGLWTASTASRRSSKSATGSRSPTRAARSSLHYPSRTTPRPGRDRQAAQARRLSVWPVRGRLWPPRRSGRPFNG